MQSIAAPEVLLQLHIAIILKNPIYSTSSGHGVMLPRSGRVGILSIPWLRRCGTGRGRPTGRFIQRYRSPVHYIVHPVPDRTRGKGLKRKADNLEGHKERCKGIIRYSTISLYQTLHQRP